MSPKTKLEKKLEKEDPAYRADIFLLRLGDCMIKNHLPELKENWALARPLVAKILNRALGPKKEGRA